MHGLFSYEEDGRNSYQWEYMALLVEFDFLRDTRYIQRPVCRAGHWTLSSEANELYVG